MEFLIPIVLVVCFFVLKNREQQQRIALLGGVLSRFEIEKLMHTLMDGYMRALGEASFERQAQVLEHLSAQEDTLKVQFQQFADTFSQVWADDALISTLPIGFPWAHKIFPAATFDGRKLMQIHASALAAAFAQAPTDAPIRNAKDRAFVITAELMLMQHSCHWFCRSRSVASARLLVQHKTRYEQVLAAVARATRTAYESLTRS